ncbi:MAG: IPT/TIG domain-containing protein [Acidimicrobiales bacterium]
MSENGDVGAVSVIADGRPAGRRRSRAGALVVFAVLALLLGSIAEGLVTAVPASADGRPTPSLTLSPTDGPAGAAPLASASGFAATEKVDFTYDGIPEGSCETDVAGDCSAQVNVPPEPAGNYTVSAEGEDSLLTATASFAELVPSISISPSSGPAGSTFNLVANGYAPGEFVETYFNGTPLNVCTADENGDCSVVDTVPAEPAGSYYVVAEGNPSFASANTIFTETLPSATDASPLDPSIVLGNSDSDEAVVIGNGGVGPAPTGEVTFYECGASENPVPCNSASWTKFDTESVGSGLNPANVGSVPFTPTSTGYWCFAAVYSGDSNYSGSSDIGTDGCFEVTSPELSVAPSSGVAGSTFQATATGFGADENVNINYNSLFTGARCTTNANGDCTATVTVPADPAGTYTVTAVGQQTELAATATFTETAPPTVTKVSPSSGPTSGGTVVTITGTNFASPSSVLFGGVAATNVTVVNATRITAVSPAGSGMVDVTVATPGGTSSTSSADQFNYVPPA